MTLAILMRDGYMFVFLSTTAQLRFLFWIWHFVIQQFHISDGIRKNPVVDKSTHTHKSNRLITKMKLQNELYFLLIFITSISFSSGALFGCKQHNIKLIQILNLLCNTTQTVSIQQRDACSGCFLRATSFEPGPRQLLALSQCATLYLNGTGYQLCAQNLAVSYHIEMTVTGIIFKCHYQSHSQVAVVGLKPTLPFFKLTPCTTGYCEFVQCIRRTNAAILVRKIAKLPAIGILQIFLIFCLLRRWTHALWPVWWTVILHAFWIDWISIPIQPHAFWQNHDAMDSIQLLVNCNNNWPKSIPLDWRMASVLPATTITMHCKLHRMAILRSLHFQHPLLRAITFVRAEQRWNNHCTMESRA